MTLEFIVRRFLFDLLDTTRVVNKKEKNYGEYDAKYETPTNRSG